MPSKRAPALTYALLLVNLAVYLLGFAFPNLTETLAASRDALPAAPWRAVTSIAAHWGLTHLAYNSLSLYIFGSRLEPAVGMARFALVYALSGVLGALLSVCFTAGLVAGASGAIFGLMGATLVYTRKHRATPDGMTFQVALALSATALIAGFATPNVANAGHLGGLATGVVLGLILIKR